MLHYYAFSNVQSFLERTEVSLRLTEKASTRGWDRTALSGQRLSTAIAALGANGAGKTSLLKPLAFLIWFVRGSFTGLKPDQPIPVETHFAAKEKPSEFEAEGEDGEGTVWRYVLRVTSKQVIHEALYRKRERFGYVFVRDWDETTSSYQIKQQDFGFNSTEAAKVRPNASLIATAAQYGVEVAKHLTGNRLRANISFAGRHGLDQQALFNAADFFAQQVALQDQMKVLLSSWDLGLQDVQLRELNVKPPVTAAPDEQKKVWYPWGIHKSRSGQIHEVPFFHESTGTQAAFVLLSDLLPALANGGIALIDEFENDLHPLMIEPILSLFDNPSTNPHGAQIILSCHSAEVLNLLHKAQIYMVEKKECESQAWRLDSVQGVRSDDNFAAKYLTGAYGAIPRV
ncbi:MAG: AAA family ATPase [Bordetella sp.]|uniref:AAA family ATPase n=1 Tax=Bordetella sp. TaxID=28081 RepID=UPI003F7BE954